MGIIFKQQATVNEEGSANTVIRKEIKLQTRGFKRVCVDIFVARGRFVNWFGKEV
jgi:hypothetical protein